MIYYEFSFPNKTATKADRILICEHLKQLDPAGYSAHKDNHAYTGKSGHMTFICDRIRANLVAIGAAKGNFYGYVSYPDWLSFKGFASSVEVMEDIIISIGEENLTCAVMFKEHNFEYVLCTLGEKLDHTQTAQVDRDILSMSRTIIKSRK